ncbi:MAG: DNA topoisomerase IB [Pseudonocardia sp.]|jgi:DNA topoisomerase I
MTAGGGTVDIDGLRYVDLCAEPGITRVRRGRGFSYSTAGGEPVRDRELLARIRGLAIPPAWREVWICPDGDGHIQAVGTDAAGRKQYRYHDRWREARDREKFDRVLRLARRLPAVREQVAAHLGERGLGRDRVLSGALRMLELGAFRVGGEQYAPDDDDSEGSFGLATLRREHVRRLRGEVRVSYVAKGGAHREIALRDPDLHRLVGSLQRSDGAAAVPDLLFYREGRGWHDVRAEDINGYLKELAGQEYTAKDLRTWNATVLGAVALAGVDPARATTARARKRALTASYEEVAAHLGNTPAVARQSYVDPRVVHAFDQGRTVAAAVRRAQTEAAGGAATRDVVEFAVIRLLSTRPVEMSA